MILTGVLKKVKKHPNVVHKPLSFFDKYPTYFDNDAPIFTYDGFYFQPDLKDQDAQKRGLGAMTSLIFVFIFYDQWPQPLKQATWYGLISFLIAYFLTIAAKITLGFTFYHIGVNFWLFPNFFESFVNPKKMLLPLAKAEIRPDFCNPISLLFRLCSASLILYSLYQFSQDEKAIEDFREIRDHMYDVYEFSTDYVLGV